jgi:anionic cell wall polymer biosynthesis LytR-Cps2A-Psr (LCP) family protein
VLFDTFEYNFGVRPDHYVNINRNTFVDVIDAMGGIYVEVPRYLSDPTFAGGKYTVSSGRTYMDGAKARWYVSSRNTTSDFDRLERQQAVLKGIFLRLLTMDGLNRAEEFYKRYSRMVYTDMTLNDLIPLINLASVLSDTDRVSRFSIDENDVTVQRLTQSGAYVLVPNQMAVFDVILNSLNP